MAISSGTSWLAGSGSSRTYDPKRGAYIPQTPLFTSQPPATTTTTASNPTPPTVAGIEPQAYEAILYGKDIPLFVGGKMLIGGRICEGPFFGGTQADPTVSFIAYHAHNIGIGDGAADYSNTVVTSARLRGQEVWNGSYIATDKLPVGKFDWRPGHTAQAPFAQSIARYGTSAIAYTEGIVSSWQDIPLKPFGGIIPFPSVLVECSRFGDPADGINREDAIRLILEYMRLQSFEFEVDVSGSDPAWVVGSQVSLEDFLRQLRAIFVNYQITHTDKIRIIEPPEFSISAELTNSNVMRGTLKFKRTDPLLLPREKRYTFIDVERDYEMNVAVAKEDRFPVPTTDAVNSTSIELPIATTAAQAVADVHVSLYEELSIRSQMEGVANRTLFGMECGDGVRFADSAVISMAARVMEVVHDFENMTVQFRAGEVIHCAISGEDEYILYVVLLLGFDGDMIDESLAEHGAATAIGGAAVSATLPLFGTGSLELDASSDAEGIYYPDDDDWDLSDANSDEFCVEIWFRPNTTTPTDSTLIGVWGGGVPNTAWMLYINASGNGELQFLAADNANVAWSSTPVSSGLSWDEELYYCRVDKDASGKCRIYQGAFGDAIAPMVGSATPTDSSILNASGIDAVLSIGCNSKTGGRTAPGTIDEVRITKGKSRSPSDDGVPIPTSAFPRANV